MADFIVEFAQSEGKEVEVTAHSGASTQIDLPMEEQEGLGW